MRVETFALFSGIAYLAAGLLGLVPAALTPAPADAPPIQVTLFHGYLLGLFAVNVLHSAVHFAIGVWGIVAGRGMTSPKVYARSLAIFYGALAVMGGIPGLAPIFGLLPIHGHDIWLHAGDGVQAGDAAHHGQRAVEDGERAGVDLRARHAAPGHDAPDANRKMHRTVQDIHGEQAEQVAVEESDLDRWRIRGRRRQRCRDQAEQPGGEIRDAGEQC